MSLISFTYGKQRVRALVVRRGAHGVHAVHEIEAGVMLEGDFADTYLTGDNGKVVPTDTIKNTVQVLAQKYLGEVLEEFALIMAGHFIKRYAQVARVTVEIVSRPWDRFAPGGRASPHTFTGRTAERPFCRVEMDREKTRLQSGVADVLLLNSTNSAFQGFPRCEYTTLPETDDRLMATRMEATWTFLPCPADYQQANAAILETLFCTFAEKFSPSLQNTLYLMALAALAAAPTIGDIHLAMPNIHYLPVNLKPFGIENNSELFLPTDEPHGQIEARVAREAGATS